MTAADWEVLTVALSRAPREHVLSQSQWAAVTERLISEVIISDAVWLSRFASFNRLLAHPVGGRVAVAACASLGRDPSSQIFGETVGALEGSRHPDAGVHVINQLVNPTNDQAFYGALLACVRKVKYGHFTSTHLNQIVVILTELLQSELYADDTRLLAAELLRLIPGGYRYFTPRQLRDAVSTDHALAHVLEHGRLVGESTAQVTVDRLVSTVVSKMPTDAGGYIDEQLPTLVNEILFSPIADVRMYTAHLVAATPYGEILARVLAEELTFRRIVDDKDRSEAMIYALRFLGGESPRALLERLVVASDVPASVNAMAARVIGHAGGRSDDGFWKDALAYHRGRWRRHRHKVNRTIIDRLVYALGIGRNDVILSDVRGDADMPESARAAAAWWLSIPAHIRQSSQA